MTGKSKRGFASMDRARQREIAAKGGRAAHAKGTAHVWSAEEARVAGRKGGEAVSQDRSHMSAIGREGGESRSAALREARLRRAQEQQMARSGNGLSERLHDREVPLPTAREGTPDRLVADAPLGEGLADVHSPSVHHEHPPERPSTPARPRPAFEERSSA